MTDIWIIFLWTSREEKSSILTTMFVLKRVPNYEFPKKFLVASLRIWSMFLVSLAQTDSLGYLANVPWKFFEVRLFLAR